MVLAGKVAIESMGGPVFGFGRGRADVFEPEKDAYWGTEEFWVGQEGNETRIQLEQNMVIESPLAPTPMGLLYINPAPPGRHAAPPPPARAIRQNFRRRGSNLDETMDVTSRPPPPD